MNHATEYERRAHVEVLLNEARNAGANFDDWIRFFSVRQNQDYVEEAREKYCDKGVVEIDKATIVSEDEFGGWVMAWVRVDKELDI